MTGPVPKHGHKGEVWNNPGLATDQVTVRMEAEQGSSALLSGIQALCRREAGRMRLRSSDDALWLFQDRPSIAEIQARVG